MDTWIPILGITLPLRWRSIGIRPIVLLVDTARLRRLLVDIIRPDTGIQNLVPPAYLISDLLPYMGTHMLLDWSPQEAGMAYVKTLAIREIMKAEAILSRQRVCVQHAQNGPPGPSSSRLESPHVKIRRRKEREEPQAARQHSCQHPRRSFVMSTRALQTTSSSPRVVVLLALAKPPFWMSRFRA